MSLRLVHVELAEANAFVASHHRHHKPVTGHRFSVGVATWGADTLVGVAIVGRPVARGTDKSAIAEVIRLCTDGTRNACSILYAACARAAGALGYKRIQTFILDSEPGVTLRAAGWRLDGHTSGRSWHTPTRPRTDSAPTCSKQRWVKDLNP